MRSITLLLVSLAAFSGCRTRLYELDEIGDLTFVPPDFRPPADLSVPPDLRPPPDLVPPYYCRPIYVVDADTRVLSAFDATTYQFVDVGRVDCPALNGASPETMSIDLSGNAWIFYSDGNLYTADLRSGSCKATGFDPTHIEPDPTMVQTYGSSFSLDAPGGTKETLYVSLGTDQVLGLIDPLTLAFQKGPDLPYNAELTGTAAAELWMYSPGSNPTFIARVDKKTGALDSRIEVPQITVIGDFAFAFWGGSFWIFNGDGPTNRDTTVYRVEKDTGKATTIVRNTRRHIVGAGVSGCAPLGLDH